MDAQPRYCKDCQYFDLPHGPVDWPACLHESADSLEGRSAVANRVTDLPALCGPAGVFWAVKQA